MTLVGFATRIEQQSQGNSLRFTNKETKTVLIINEHMRLSGIPEEAYQYVVNGQTPLEWYKL